MKPTTEKGSDRNPRLKKWITVLLRIVVGGVFIFSGLVKSIDPWGTFYKMEEYIRAMGLDVWPNLLLAGDFILCGAEFLLGVLLMLGCYRRSVPILMGAFMAVMLPLTLWLAVANPVADCGCFGDAVILSNWATFWKNVVLTAGIVYLIIYNKRAKCVVNPYLQWIALAVTGAYIVFIEIVGYNAQPLVDFRPYQVGGDIVEIGNEHAAGGEEADNLVFVYEKDGKQQEFGIDDELPDESDGWKFVERREVPAEKSANGGENATDESPRNFRIWSEDGANDLTEEVAAPEGKRLFLMMPDLDNVSISTTWQINSLYTWAMENSIDMIAVVSGDDKVIERWKDLSLAAYPIYTADDTQIKEVVRGNPAVVYTENGKIVWKSSLKALDTNDFMAEGTSKDPKSFAHDGVREFRNISLNYLAIMAVLIVLSFSPMMKRILFDKPRRRRYIKNDGRAEAGKHTAGSDKENKEPEPETPQP